MGRLPAGTAPTPHKVRLAGYRQALEERGGSRLIADIEKEATDALHEIMALGDENGPFTRKEAVTRALIAYRGILAGAAARRRG